MNKTPLIASLSPHVNAVSILVGLNALCLDDLLFEGKYMAVACVMKRLHRLTFYQIVYSASNNSWDYGALLCSGGVHLFPMSEFISCEPK